MPPDPSSAPDSPRSLLDDLGHPCALFLAEGAEGVPLNGPRRGSEPRLGRLSSAEQGQIKTPPPHHEPSIMPLPPFSGQGQRFICLTEQQSNKEPGSSPPYLSLRRGTPVWQEETSVTHAEPC